jgi:16S rRNA (guanine527-N7)-methyltransferase
VKFVEDYAKEKSLDVTGIAARAEEFARENRDRFMVVTARAVASLRIPIELAVPLLKVGGVFIAMKGPGFEQEIAEAQGALKKLNCEIDYIYEDQLPESNENRSFIYIKKIKETPKKFPRLYGEIKNKAL